MTCVPILAAACARICSMGGILVKEMLAKGLAEGAPRHHRALADNTAGASPVPHAAPATQSLHVCIGDHPLHAAPMLPADAEDHGTAVACPYTSLACSQCGERGRVSLPPKP